MIFFVFRDLGEGIITSKSLTEAMDKITQTPLKDQVEKIWVIGGSSVYQVIKSINISKTGNPVLKSYSFDMVLS